MRPVRRRDQDPTGSLTLPEQKLGQAADKDAPSAARGEAGANLQKVFAYGLRNTVGMDFDPVSGALWLEQNGDDSFTELDLVPPGMNGGWIQVMGPFDRIGQFKQIETSQQFFGLQQIQIGRASCRGRV